MKSLLLLILLSSCIHVDYVKDNVAKVGSDCFYNEDAQSCQALANHYKDTKQPEKRAGTLMFYNCGSSKSIRSNCSETMANVKSEFNDTTKLIKKLCTEIDHKSCYFSPVRDFFDTIKRDELLDSIKPQIASCKGVSADGCYDAAIKLESSNMLSMAKNVLEQSCIEGHQKSCKKREFLVQDIARMDKIEAEKRRVEAERFKAMAYYEAQRATTRAIYWQSFQQSLFPRTQNINLNVNGKIYNYHSFGR